jgi:hypothetical protein
MLQVLDFSDLLWHPTKWLDDVEHAGHYTPGSPTSPIIVEPASQSDDEDDHDDPAKDGGAVNIRSLCKVLDKTATSEEDRLQYETVSQLGDTSSAVCTHSLFYSCGFDYRCLFLLGCRAFLEAKAELDCSRLQRDISSR